MPKGKKRKKLGRKAIHKLTRELDLIYKFAIELAADSEIVMEKAYKVLTKLRKEWERLNERKRDRLQHSGEGS